MMDSLESLESLRLLRARRSFAAPEEPDVAGATRRAIAAAGLFTGLAPGARIAIAAGSRKVAGQAAMLAAAVSVAREQGLDPFVVAAMGSHGGGTAEGQLALLAELGIRDETMDCPVISSMATVELGRTPDGIPVHLDAFAAEAHGILLAGRVKPHTAFAGSIGSGPLKMLAIGLGKKRGAVAVHQAALAGLGLERAIRSVAGLLLARVPVLGALALLEGPSGGVARIEGVRAAVLERDEPRLLLEARALRPGLGFERIDLLIVDRMGKDISGTGMDPWVIGRLMASGEPEPLSPRISRIYVRRLSPASHGNAHGVGLADFVHRRLAESIDWEATRVNSLAAGAPQKARLPLVMASDREAILAALMTSGAASLVQARVVHIRDTHDLSLQWISPALREEALAIGGFEIAGDGEPLEFDAEGDLPGA